MKCKAILVLLLLGLCVSLNFVSAATYHLPFPTTIRAGLKVHFGSYWISTTATDITIDANAWFTNGWTNYTVHNLGTQQIYKGSKPTTVIIDGTMRGEGDGWTYALGTVTVNEAYSSAKLGWLSDITPPNYSSISYNTTAVSQPCLFRCRWTDDFGLSGFIFHTNNTGVWVADAFLSLTGMDDWAETTKTLNAAPDLVIAFYWQCNDTSNNWRTTSTGVLTLTTTSSAFPSASNIAYNTTVEATPCLFSCKWTDDLGLSGYIFSYRFSGVWANDTWTALGGLTAWANKTKTLPVSGTVYFMWYCNDTDNQWSTTAIGEFAVTETLWSFTFNHRDLDSNLVDPYITWKLYDGAVLLDYVEGAETLPDGNYTLITFYNYLEINTKYLPTSVYGDTVVEVPLIMKQHTSVSGGYIAFDQTETIFINVQTSTNLTFTVNGANALMIVDVPENATNVYRNGLNQTGWEYVALYNFIQLDNSQQPAIWTFIFPQGVVPPYEAMKQELYEGDFIGFLLYPYLNLIGSLFYGLIMLMFVVTLYNRYHSIQPILILFVVLGGSGGIVSLLIPETGVGIAWVFLLFGLAGLLYKTFR